MNCKMVRQFHEKDHKEFAAYIARLPSENPFNLKCAYLRVVPETIEYVRKNGVKSRFEKGALVCYGLTDPFGKSLPDIIRCNIQGVLTGNEQGQLEAICALNGSMIILRVVDFKPA